MPAEGLRSPVVLMPSAPSSRLLATLPRSLPPSAVRSGGISGAGPRPRASWQKGVHAVQTQTGCTHGGVGGRGVRGGVQPLVPHGLDAPVSSAPLQPAEHAAPRQQTTPLISRRSHIHHLGASDVSAPGSCLCGGGRRGARQALSHPCPSSLRARREHTLRPLPRPTGQPWARIWPLRLGFPICKQGGL